MPAYNDLMLLKSTMHYTEVDKLVSNSAEKAFLRHLWYSAKCDSSFSSLRWLSLSKKIESHKNFYHGKALESVICPSTRFGCGFGKPDFPSNVDKSASLSERITKDLYFFMSCKLTPVFCLKILLAGRALIHTKVIPKTLMLGM